MPSTADSKFGSEFKFTGAVAFFDILGFKDHFETSENGTSSVDLDAIRDKVIGQLIISSKIAYSIVQDDFAHFKHFTGIEYPNLGQLYFSDSLVLYMPLGQKEPFSSPDSVIRSIAYTSSLLIARSIWVNIPLRGAISYGECLISNDPLYALGKPLIEAYDLQKRQLWVGAALADSALARYGALKDDFVIEYGVRCRHNKTSTLWVVNWPANSLGPSVKRSEEGGKLVDGPMPDWDVCFACRSKDPKIRDEVRVKMENTVKFFMTQESRIGGTMFGPEQRNHGIDWRNAYFEWE